VVIGVRRGGKTLFLMQCRADRLAQGRRRKWQIMLSLEGKRLAALEAADIAWLLEELAF
jgi:hypothetical protein